MISDANKLKLSTLEVELKADTSKLPRSTAIFNRFTNRLVKSAERTEQKIQGIARASSLASMRFASFAQNANAKISGLIASVSNLKTLMIGIGTISTLKSIDSFQQLDNKIKIATRSTNDYLQTYQALLDISHKTGTSLASNTKIFQITSLLKDELGITNAQALQFNKNIAQLGLIAGSSAQENQSIQLQLAHGLAGGKFNLQEFNIILQNNVLLAQKLAKGLGFDTVAGLKLAVHEGKIFAKDVIDAILSQTIEINREVKEIPENLTTAFNSFRLGLSQVSKALDDNLGLTNKLSKALKSAGSSLNNIFSTTDIGALNLQGDELTAYYDFVARVAKERVEDEKRLNEQQTKLKEQQTKEDQRREVLASLFSIDLARETAEFTLAAQAKGFRDQLALASQHSEKMFKIYKALSIAQLAMESTKAISAAYNSGTALGGAALGGVFSAVSAAAGAFNINALMSQNFAGGRALGGEVLGGSIYRVSESRPELLSINDKSYIMAGGKGNVEDIGQGAKEINVNIYQNGAAGGGAQVTKKENSEEINIDVMLDDLENRMSSRIKTGNSTLGNALENQYGFNRIGGY